MLLIEEHGKDPRTGLKNSGIAYPKTLWLIWHLASEVGGIMVTRWIQTSPLGKQPGDIILQKNLPLEECKNVINPPTHITATIFYINHTMQMIKQK